MSGAPTRVTVLGAGMVGRAIARDLAQEARFRVQAVDRDAGALRALAEAARVDTAVADLRAPGRVAEAVAGADLVICAVPGAMGFATLRAVIEAGKDVVDISFFPEEAFELDALAQARGVTAVVDCGVAPGLCNLQAGYAAARLDAVERYACYVGGLPQVRTWPYEYKAVFSPADVLEEYTRPARFVEHGQPVVRPALSDVELREVPGVGTLEAFNTDGLRTLRHTLDAPWMCEKTMRYPGHAALMRVFRESGFFDPEPIEVEGQRVRPLAVTSKLLFDQWKLRPGEPDLTVMHVIVAGVKDGRARTYTFDLLDTYDPARGISAMARTTGYTCTLVARMVVDGAFTEKGICPPEFVGRTPGCYETLLAGYAARGIHVQERVTEVERAA